MILQKRSIYLKYGCQELSNDILHAPFRQKKYKKFWTKEDDLLNTTESISSTASKHISTTIWNRQFKKGNRIIFCYA